VVQNGLSTGWGQVINFPENKHREGLGFSPSAITTKPGAVIEPIRDTFHSAEFIHSPLEANAITEDNPEEMIPSFVTRGLICRNWVDVDVPYVTHLSK